MICSEGGSPGSIRRLPPCFPGFWVVEIAFALETLGSALVQTVVMRKCG
jgi:hypothetical protein